MDDREPWQLTRFGAAKVLLVVPVRDHVTGRSIRLPQPLECVLHHAPVHGDDRSGVADHFGFESAFQHGHRVGANGDVMSTNRENRRRTEA